MTAATVDQAGGAPARTFLGQPMGLAYLAFTEAWERFSYYGMTALLVLYMSQSLLTPGHVEHVAGFGAFKAGLEAMFGPMSPLALTSQIYGLYTGFVYFTPVFGGWIADRFLGRRTAVVLGALLMSAGHIAMAFDAAFLVALLLLVVGCGFLKGNISAQVGGLYAKDDGEGRTRGFMIFSMAINVGAVVGPLLCGLLAQLYGWHAGFGLAGGLMLLALATYLAGLKHLPEGQGPRPAALTPAAPLDAHQKRVVAGLFLAMALTIPQSIIYYQNTNIGLIWIDGAVDLNLLGFRIPTAWFNSIDAFVSIVSVPFLFALWRWQARGGGEPGEIGKIATGAFIAAVANLLLVAASLSGGRVSALFPVLYDVLLGVGFLYYWPPLLALVSRAAPLKLRSTLMGTAFLTLFAGNLILGRIGGLYEHTTPAAFWTLQVAIGVIGGLVALMLRPRLEALLLKA
jgi:proton-dependent oligopeptide transporter, POT family